MYVIFDVEGVPDPALARITTLPGETPEAMNARLLDNGKRLFNPLLHRPVVVSLLVVDAQLKYITHKNIACRTDCVVAKEFWPLMQQGLDQRFFSRIITFGGMVYDFPVLEVAALRCHVDFAWWLRPFAKNWDQPRKIDSGADAIHWDLRNLMPFAAQRSNLPGLTMHHAARMAGWPGKIDTAGDQVEALLAKERPGDGTDPALEQIIDYCTCDVLNTYGVLQMLLTSGAGLAGEAGPNSPNAVEVIEKMTAGRGQECQSFIRRARHPTSEELF